MDIENNISENERAQTLAEKQEIKKMGMSPEQIENIRIEKLKKINEVREQINTVAKEKNRLERELVVVSEALREARHTKAVLTTEAEILESEFWAAKQ